MGFPHLYVYPGVIVDEAFVLRCDNVARGEARGGTERTRKQGKVNYTIAATGQQSVVPVTPKKIDTCNI